MIDFLQKTPAVEVRRLAGRESAAFAAQKIAMDGECLLGARSRVKLTFLAESYLLRRHELFGKGIDPKRLLQNDSPRSRASREGSVFA